MDMDIIKRFICEAKKAYKKVDNHSFNFPITIESAYRLATNIEKLLKEQEAVEPSFKQDEKGIFVWCCGSCGAYMYHIYDGIDKAKEYAKFCRQCGKPVLWEGR